MKNDSSLPFLLVLLTALVMNSEELHSQSIAFEKPPIRYNEAPVNNRVSQLASQLRQQTASLRWEDSHGYLKSILELLEIPVSSQTLVFSKTSMQIQHITPRTPRALYFNDDTYVGWCHDGEIIEIATTDPRQGAIFYTIEQTQFDQPKLIRDRGQCITCHASSRTQDVPGYLVRSMFVDARGYPKFGSGTFLTDHTSPFDERWGGWYVTGTHGEMRHMGNEIAIGRDSDARIDRDLGANVVDLAERFRVDRYLSPHSDLVALMVLEHQTQMHNAITAANFEARTALAQNQQMNEVLDRPEGYLSESTERRLDRAAENVLKYMLMCDEFPLTSPVAGTSDFSEQFARAGIKDSQGRSLRDLDLQTRLFRYPCSFLIHSEAFARLPAPVLTRTIDKLVDVLKGRDTSPSYAHLSRETRQAILEILREQEPDLMAFQTKSE